MTATTFPARSKLDKAIAAAIAAMLAFNLIVIAEQFESGQFFAQADVAEGSLA